MTHKLSDEAPNDPIENEKSWLRDGIRIAAQEASIEQLRAALHALGYADHPMVSRR